MREMILTLPAEVEGENGGRHELLVHHVVEHWRDMIDGDLRISHSEDAFEINRKRVQFPNLIINILTIIGHITYDIVFVFC